MATETTETGEKDEEKRKKEEEEEKDNKDGWEDEARRKGKQKGKLSSWGTTIPMGQTVLSPRTQEA